MYHHYCLLVFTLLIFFYEFMRSPIKDPFKARRNDLPTRIDDLKIPSLNESYPRHFDRMVVIVIDALRLDFITPENMPFTVKTMHSRGCFNRIRVEAPTVTMPRIKALTAGYIPQYMDALKNLAGSDELEDSWLHTANRKGFRIVFFGDTITWLTLFAKETFTRVVSSQNLLNLYDYEKGEAQIKKDVEIEVEKKDWDIMIMHFLELDHIGHVHGPISNKIRPKLLEYDNIIRKVCNSSAFNEKTMILVMGDHGMRNEGGQYLNTILINYSELEISSVPFILISHGGTTVEELYVPLVVLGPNCKNSSFAQTDIPANIAVSLGIDIPYTSIGQISKSFLNYLTQDQYLFALHYNVKSLANLGKSCGNVFQNASKFHAKYLRTLNPIYANIAKYFYSNCSRTISKALYYSPLAKHDLFLKISILMFSISTIFACNIITGDSHMILECFAIVLASLSNFLIGSTLILYVTVMFTAILIVKMNLKCWFIYKKVTLHGYMRVFLPAMGFVYSIGIWGNSFIESEHLFWYYFGTSYFLLAMIKTHRKNKNDALKMLLIVVVCLRLATVLDSLKKSGDIIDYANLTIDIVFQKFFMLFIFVIIYLTLSRAHQTITLKKHCLYIVTLIFIFLLKCDSPHSVVLGKVIWMLIFIEFLSSNVILTKNICVLIATLLLKPHNIPLVPLALLVSENLFTLKQPPEILSVLINLYSNYLYSAQGHRNHIGSIDFTVGFTALKDYNLPAVATQCIAHMFIFMILFNVLALDEIDSPYKPTFWRVLFSIKCYDLLLMCMSIYALPGHQLMIHYFIPKMVMESVHLLFLFVQVSIWYFYNLVPGRKIVNVSSI